MRLFKTKEFVRLARKYRVRDEDLREAVERAEAGLVDATIGANLISSGWHGKAVDAREATAQSSF